MGSAKGQRLSGLSESTPSSGQETSSFPHVSILLHSSQDLHDKPGDQRNTSTMSLKDRTKNWTKQRSNRVICLKACSRLPALQSGSPSLEIANQIKQRYPLEEGAFQLALCCFPFFASSVRASSIAACTEGMSSTLLAFARKMNSLLVGWRDSS